MATPAIQDRSSRRRLSGEGVDQPFAALAAVDVRTAIIIAYDDSDGWYDHVMPPIVRTSERRV